MSGQITHHTSQSDAAGTSVRVDSAQATSVGELLALLAEVRTLQSSVRGLYTAADAALSRIASGVESAGHALQNAVDGGADLDPCSVIDPVIELVAQCDGEVRCSVPRLAVCVQQQLAQLEDTLARVRARDVDWDSVAIAPEKIFARPETIQGLRDLAAEHVAKEGFREVAHHILAEPSCFDRELRGGPVDSPCPEVPDADMLRAILTSLRVDHNAEPAQSYCTQLLSETPAAGVSERVRDNAALVARRLLSVELAERIRELAAASSDPGADGGAIASHTGTTGVAALACELRVALGGGAALPVDPSWPLSHANLSGAMLFAAAGSPQPGQALSSSHGVLFWRFPWLFSDWWMHSLWCAVSRSVIHLWTLAHQPAQRDHGGNESTAAMLLRAAQSVAPAFATRARVLAQTSSASLMSDSVVSTLPIDVPDLPDGIQNKSLFYCPVTGVQCLQPKLLVCSHVIGAATLETLVQARGGSGQVAKCPYCKIDSPIQDVITLVL